MPHPKDLTYQIGHTDRWVLTFDGGKKAIWTRPNTGIRTSVIVADIQRLIAKLAPKIDGPFPVPVDNWSSAKLEMFCCTQFRTFNEPHRWSLEMPEISITQRDRTQQPHRDIYEFGIDNGRNRISIAHYLGARFIPIEIPSQYLGPATEFLGCRFWYRYVFKWK